jgi:hypothetical protein
MDLSQLIIEHPGLAMMSSLPLFLFAISVKVAITLWNPGQERAETGQSGAEAVEPPRPD